MISHRMAVETLSNFNRKHLAVIAVGSVWRDVSYNLLGPSNILSKGILLLEQSFQRLYSHYGFEYSSYLKTFLRRFLTQLDFQLKRIHAWYI